MANRTFMDKSYSLVKREVRLYAAVGVGAAGAVTLLKWNYPTLGTGTGPANLARTYSPAPLPNTLPSGAAYPLQYSSGAEGVRGVVRQGAGTWILTLQDAYQRVLAVDFVGSEPGGAVGVTDVALTGAGPSGFIASPSFPANSIGLVFHGYGGAAADPAVGSTILLAITLMDAKEP